MGPTPYRAYPPSPCSGPQGKVAGPNKAVPAPGWVPVPHAAAPSVSARRTDAIPTRRALAAYRTRPSVYQRRSVRGPSRPDRGKSPREGSEQANESASARLEDHRPAVSFGRSAANPSRRWSTSRQRPHSWSRSWPTAARPITLRRTPRPSSTTAPGVPAGSPPCRLWRAPAVHRHREQSWARPRGNRRSPSEARRSVDQSWSTGEAPHLPGRGRSQAPAPAGGADDAIDGRARRNDKPPRRDAPLALGHASP